MSYGINLYNTQGALICDSTHSAMTASSPLSTTFAATGAGTQTATINHASVANMAYSPMILSKCEDYTCPLYKTSTYAKMLTGGTTNTFKLAKQLREGSTTSGYGLVVYNEGSEVVFDSTLPQIVIRDVIDITEAMKTTARANNGLIISHATVTGDLYYCLDPLRIMTSEYGDAYNKWVIMYGIKRVSSSSCSLAPKTLTLTANSQAMPTLQWPQKVLVCEIRQ